MITLTDQIKYNGTAYLDPKIAVGTNQQYATIEALIADLGPKGQITVNMKIIDLDQGGIFNIIYDNGWGYVPVSSGGNNQQYIRIIPSEESDTIIIEEVVKVEFITINQLVYFGKIKDSSGFDGYDYMYQNVYGDTIIQINEIELGFKFAPDMIVNVAYILNN